MYFRYISLYILINETHPSPIQEGGEQGQLWGGCTQEEAAAAVLGMITKTNKLPQVKSLHRGWKV